MSTTLLGAVSGLGVDVDEARNLMVAQCGIPGYPSAGGYYTVAGKSAGGSDAAGIIAASLASGSLLMAARVNVASVRRAYVSKVRVSMTIATAGAAGGIATKLGCVGFTTATPTGGNARTATRIGSTKGSATDFNDIRDSNAALTVTSVVFPADRQYGITEVPNGSTNVAPFEWIFEPVAPIELGAGDGIGLRTVQVGPATATWNFSWTMHWFER